MECDTIAQGHQLLGHILLDLGLPSDVLHAYLDARKLHESIGNPDSTAVAGVCESIAYAYSELGDVDLAFQSLKSATSIYDAAGSIARPRSDAIRAMTCLRAGNAGDALAALQEYWSLQNKTKACIEASQHPKDSGDVMLLARIFRLQGESKEASRLCERAIIMRRDAYGAAGGPKLADSIFFLNQLLDDQGNLYLAAVKLQEIVKMRPGMPEMRPHLARAYWFLANTRVQIGIEKDNPEVVEARRAAWGARSAIEEREWRNEDTDEGYMRLVPWMLW
jgi:tetratricopeptide (TPR) repeat protein